jgi:glycosyltransferase involved in cell wall biosynthesis
MSTPLTISLCISTYNSPISLGLCLDSVLLQTRIPDEIIIGDDGSTEETKKLIECYKSKFKVPLVHCWHPDEGYRLAAARNNCFRSAKGSYLIQIDGDLILHNRFVNDHVEFAKPNTFLCGGRSLINKKATVSLQHQQSLDWNLITSNLSKSYNAFRSVSMALLVYLFKRGYRQTKYVIGANMSFWKHDLMRVNGYDENFKGWGKEDNDIAIRLFLAGTKVRFLKHAAITYHLDHSHRPVDNLNVLLLENTYKSKSFFAKNGIVKDGQ